MAPTEKPLHTYAYLGPEGTYSHEAAREFAARAKGKVELVECVTITEVFETVDRGRVDFGVVPIENALEGSVNETLDAFAFFSEAQIVDEAVIDIHQNLIVAPGTKLADVKTIVSHPQALGQTGKWRMRNLPLAVALPDNSTAEAVRLAVGKPETAAIGSALAAETFGGEILAADIEDRLGNQTRFVLIGNDTGESPASTAGYKTSLALFMKEDRPGTLLMILEEFAYAQLNMTKIQSRPTKKALGDYMFWVDVEGHVNDRKLQTALDCLRLKLRKVKVIGSYPAAGELEGLGE